MEKRTLYIVIAVVLAVVVVFSISNFTGQSTLGLNKGACFDSDGGRNYAVKGTASYANRATIYTDECITTGGTTEGRWLKEYLCLAGDVTNVRYDCSCSGDPSEDCTTTKCVNAACV